MVDSEDSLNAPTPELIPLHHPGEKSTSSEFRYLRGQNLLFHSLRGGDWLLLCVGTCFAFIHGICFPLITLILGHMTDILLSQAEQRCNSSNSSLSYLSQYDEETDSYEELSIENLLQNTSSGFVNPQQLLDIFSSEPGSISQEEFEDLLSLLSAILGITVLVAAFLQPFCWELCSSRQLHCLLQDLFCQLLWQNMAWYDCHKDKDLASQLISHVDQIHHGTGARAGMLLQYSATCASGFIIAFIVNWRLTIFILPLFFQCLVAPHLLDKVYLHLTSKRYHEAGQIAEEILSNFQPGDDTDGTAVELNCYKEAIQQSQKATLKRYYSIISGMLVVYLVANAVLAVALWQNWKLIEMGCLAPGAVATVFFSVIGGMLSINKILPLGAAVMSATQSAAALTVIIDNASAEKGTELTNKTEITGKVQFKDVSFSYPLDSKKQVQCNNSFLYLNYLNIRLESVEHKINNGIL
ncbi:hypothetical protein B7P43_G09773 [Cryptotermes secundus]|uniref:ABC transmembrane type-1 domain-containing protein n=1 Tax=Cryptotermes secundus TaxID=105785 RepID=A0A2J7RH33_9NEOP|nr:hypothetical protein B7P43_G09773 [Cryptotermes secundus]